MVHNRGLVTVHWRTEEPTSETFENVSAVRVAGGFLVIQQASKRKLERAIMFPSDLIDSVEFDVRAMTYADVWED